MPNHDPETTAQRLARRLNELHSACVMRETIQTPDTRLSTCEALQKLDLFSYDAMETRIHNSRGGTGRVYVRTPLGEEVGCCILMDHVRQSELKKIRSDVFTVARKLGHASPPEVDEDGDISDSLEDMGNFTGSRVTITAQQYLDLARMAGVVP